LTGPVPGAITGGVIAGVTGGVVAGGVAAGVFAAVGGTTAGVFTGAGAAEVGIAAGVVFVGAAAEPAAPADGAGVFTVVSPVPGLSLPPHAHRSAATPKHVVNRDLMTASNIGNNWLNKNCTLTT